MQPNQTSVTPTNAIENPTTKNGDTDQKSTVIQPSASNIVTPQAVQISNDNADNPTSKGLNTTPVQPMKQVDGTKGIWKWVAKLVSFSNVGSRMKAEMQLEQNYATQHGLQYQSVTQELPTGPDGVGSVILSSGGNTIFYHHMSGKIQNYDYDSVVWFHRHYKTGLSFGNQSNFPIMDTVQAGRITINSALPSLILASNSGGLAVDDHNLFSSFKNAGSVSLEGDFNKYFDLYSPRDDPVSAFNTLPPNLMAVLIDEFQDTCVEFVGNSIYLMIVTDETQSSFGDGVPVFNAQVNDKLISQSLKLASFFKTPLAENNQPINPNEVITEKHIPTIHIG